jgi:hypothetical protein
MNTIDPRAQSVQNPTFTFTLTDVQKAALEAQAAELDLSPEAHAAVLIKRALDNYALKTPPGQPLRVDLSHRLGPEGYRASKNVGDMIILMTQRLSSVLWLILHGFEEEDCRAADSIIIGGLYNALAEVEDIESVGYAFPQPTPPPTGAPSPFRVVPNTKANMPCASRCIGFAPNAANRAATSCRGNATTKARR